MCGTNESAIATHVTTHMDNAYEETAALQKQ